MSTTAIVLKIGLNLEIGSVPISLNATVSEDVTRTQYTFNGCMQSAAIDIGSFMSYVGQQFGVEVELPPELNLKAIIDYIAGQVIYTSPADSGTPTTTELGASAKFDLVYRNGGKEEKFSFTFYADTILTKGAATNAYIVGGSIDTDLKFANLPLLGDIPIFNEYVLKHLGFSYTNIDPQAAGKPVTFNIPKVAISPNPLSTLQTGKEKNNYTIDAQGNKTTFNLANKGFSFTAGLMREGSDQSESNFALPMDLPKAPVTNTPAGYYKSAGPVQVSPPASPVHWIDINKTFGPINLQKIGLNYASGEATFGFSAGFAVGGFELDVQGLSITFPLPLPGMPAGDTLSFDLEGLAMQFSSGSLTIGGAFLKTIVDEITNYYGEVVVQVGSYGFKALGGYAPIQKGLPAPSFFLYANLEVPLGGPPFLYVSGLAFGFGINRALILPNIQTLPGYLLLPSKAPKEGATPTQTISDVMPKLAIIFRDEPGEYWVAAGLQFTSFDMISAFALATVSFGVDLQIGLLGAVSISLPQGSPNPLAYIEVDLIASFTPKTGLLAVEGVIAPTSYLMGDFVKLSGGFAFYIWFSGAHRGDFVATLGGYHPAYNPPAWYPTVPRMSMSFALGPFQSSGSAYVALTPSMFMAGLQFKATFSEGPIQAWFNAGVDFLIGWAPFLYEADAYVNIGCSVDLGLFTLSVSIGADLKVWGPPFGGKAHVDLDVVSFTISFGSSAPAPAPVTWAVLENEFLPNAKSPVPQPKSMRMSRMMGSWMNTATDPQTTANVSASVALGLLQKDVDGYNWIVDPNNFEIITATTIPANIAHWSTGNAAFADIPHDPVKYGIQPVDVSHLPYLELSEGTVPFSNTDVWNPDINVKPLKLKPVQSVHTIALIKADENGGFNDYLNTIAIEPVLESSNTALWGDPDVKEDANNPTLIPKTLVGFRMIPLPRNPDTVNNVLLIELIYTQGYETTFAYTSEQPDTRYTVTSNVDPTTFDLGIVISGAASKTFTNKEYILHTLIEDWVTQQRDTILDDLTANGFNTLTPTEINLTAMGETEALTDWPMVGILGKII